MTSITSLTKAEMLTQAMEFIARALVDCGFAVCSQQRTHTEPNKIVCCDCTGDGYAIVGWIVRTFPADGRLNEVPSSGCPVFDATMFGFTVARCWPESSTIPNVGGPMDATAVELANVLDCLQAALGSCQSNPILFTGNDNNEALLRCLRLQVGAYVAEKDSVVTPYGDGQEGGKVTAWCAGWRWSITVA